VPTSDLVIAILKDSPAVFSALVVGLVIGKFKGSYERRHDSFRISALFAFSAVAAFFSIRAWAFTTYLDRFSIWLGSFAILPQVILIGRSKRMDVVTPVYTGLVVIWQGFEVAECAMRVSGGTIMFWGSLVVRGLTYGIFVVRYLQLKLRTRGTKLPYTR
jgi:hypothetical protein